MNNFTKNCSNSEVGISGCWSVGKLFYILSQYASGETVLTGQAPAFLVAPSWNVVSVTGDWSFIQNNLQGGNEFNKHEDIAK